MVGDGMTAMTPAGTYRRNHGRGHSYYIDGVKVDGVTTILDRGMPKTALYNWAGREAAKLAVDNWEELSHLPVMERYERIAEAPNKTKTTAGVRGTRVHHLAERLVHGESIEVPEAERGHVEACVKFIDSYNVQPMLTEFPVFSRKHKYAGSPDLAAWTSEHDLPVLIDWKTNRRGPYGESALQLAAYAGADFYLAPRIPLPGQGVEHEWVETPLPKFAAHWVVWLRSDGYDIYPMHKGEEVFRGFLYVQQVARVQWECRDWKGDALPVPAKAAS
jgi:hypothetical protein